MKLSNPPHRNSLTFENDETLTKRSIIFPRFVQFIAILLFVILLALPQSYTLFKQLFLVVYLCLSILLLASKNNIVVYRDDLLFYFFVALLGLFGSIVGVLNETNDQGIFAGLKLYIGYSLVFFLMVTIQRNTDQLEEVHRAIILSGIFIAAINFLSVFDSYYNAGIISLGVIEQLGLYVNVDQSYIKLHSHNIASLFFITGYLLVIKFSRNIKTCWPKLATFSLFLCLLTVVLSGRRALWLLVLCSPLIILFLSYVTGNFRGFSKGVKMLFFTYLVLIFTAGISLIFVLGSLDSEVLYYFGRAFSADDERSVQLSYLITSFVEHAVFGSGFGGVAGYIRSEEAPWEYELTYFKMLFNFGVVGCLFIFGIFCYFSRKAILSVHRNRPRFPILLGILVGFYLFLIGSYSNPYFEFFDGIFLISLFVLIANYRPINRMVKLDVTRH